MFLCHISAIFEDIDLKFYTHIYQSLPSDIFFLKILILKGKLWKGKNNIENFENFENFQDFKIRDSSFVAIVTKYTSSHKR